MIISSNSLSRGSGMLYQVDYALLHAMSGIDLSRVRTELRLLLPEAYQQKSDGVERGRHCYAIMSSTYPAQASIRASCQDRSYKHKLRSGSGEESVTGTNQVRDSVLQAIGNTPVVR